MERSTSSTASRSALVRWPGDLRAWLVGVCGALTVAFSAWGLGGVQPWTLHTLAVGGALTALLALGPGLAQGRDRARGQTWVWVNRSGWSRLLRWPFFWLSLFFLLYLLIAALNPNAAVVLEAGVGWWVEPREAPVGSWLPASVRSEYRPMNAWRVLVVFTAAFTLAWAIWAGLNRRKPVLLVLWALMLSGSLMALVGVLQKLTGAEAVLWRFPSSNVNFWGSFFYRNQGAAYLNLILVAAGFLYFYHALKTRQRARSGGPHFLCVLLYAATATSIALALSRGGVLFGLLLTVGFLLLLLFFSLQGLFHVRSFVVTGLTVLLLGVGVYSVVQYVDLEAIEERFGDVESSLQNADQDARALSTRATWDMAQDRLVLGWGPGSFRYIFPMYQRDYPEIFYGRYDRRSQQWVGRKFYRYAHNDLVQFVAEYGVVGTFLVFGAIATLLGQALWRSGEHNFAVLFLLAGAAQAFSHAFVDFIFNSPAYWLAFLALLVSCLKLLELEVRR